VRPWPLLGAANATRLTMVLGFNHDTDGRSRAMLCLTTQTLWHGKDEGGRLQWSNSMNQ
jgi:hypothetical protein